MQTFCDASTQTVIYYEVVCCFVLFSCPCYATSQWLVLVQEIISDWNRMYSDCCSLRPWDCMNDVIQYETDFVIQTKTHHQTPIVHTTSIIAGTGSTSCKDKKAAASRSHSRHSSMDHATSTKARVKRVSLKHVRDPAQENASASAVCDSESSLSAGMLHCWSVLNLTLKPYHTYTVRPTILRGLWNSVVSWNHLHAMDCLA